MDLVEKIVVYEANTSYREKDIRQQSVNIYYKYVGIVNGAMDR